MPAKTSWAQRSDVLPMFPTLVWKIELDSQLCESINPQVLRLVARLRKDAPTLAAGRGWQSIQHLHTFEELGELVNCVNRATAVVLRFLRIGHRALDITACWATVLAPGAEHRAHTHPNNYLSGVYYLRTRPGADTIAFHDPRSQTNIIRPPVTELTGENTDEVVVRVKEGMLLLFPAYLSHSVSPNSSDGERISISFNIMFSQFTETLTQPLWSPSR